MLRRFEARAVEMLFVQPAVFKGFGSSSPSWGAGVLFSWGSTHRASLPQNPGEPYDR